MIGAIVNGAIAGVLLALAVQLGLRLVPRRVLGSGTRYVVWWAVLLGVAFLPVSYLPARRPAPVAQTIPSPPELSPPTQLAPPAVTPLPASSSSVRLRFPLVVTVGAWSRWLLPAWALLSGCMLLRLFASCLLLARRKRLAVAIPQEFPVRVLRSGGAGSPVLAGLWRPAILIPGHLLEDLTDVELAQVVLHESAHLARFDDWALVAERFIEALLPWHPGVRWVACQIDLERELACDALVVERTGLPREYAACLLHVVETCGRRRAEWAGAGVGSQLGVRVNRLLDGEREAPSGKRRLCLATVLVFSLVFCACLTPRMVVLAQAQAPAAHPPAPPAVPAFAAPQAAPPVLVPVTVQDFAHRSVPALTKESFRIYEDGVEQQLSGFEEQEPPVSVELIVDRSGSMRDKDYLVDAAIVQLVTSANPADEFVVWTFNNEVQFAGPFANDPVAIVNQVHSIGTRSGTAVRDAILQASQWTGARYRYRKLLVLSDGIDNASSTSPEALRAAVHLPLSVITVGGTDDPRYLRWLHNLASWPRTEVLAVGNLDAAAIDLVRPVVYQLRYQSNNPVVDGKYRRIKVDVVTAPSGTLIVRHRAGYYAVAH